MMERWTNKNHCLRLWRLSVILAVATLLSGCSDDLIQPPDEPLLSKAPLLSSAVDDQARHHDPVPDQYIVILNNRSPKSNIAAADLVSAREDSLVRTFSSVFNGFVARLAPSSVETVRESPWVEAVVQDEWLTPDSEPSIRLGPSVPWGLDRIDQRTLPLDGIYNTLNNGSGVNIYVIDTGIYKNHREFDYGVRARHGYDFVQDGNGSEDCTGHGTGVAAVAGGTSYGVSPGTTLWAVRIGRCSDGNATTSNMIAALEWVALNHIKPAVANLSFSTPISSSVPWSSSSLLDSAAMMLRNSGVLLAASAGNDDENSCLHSLKHLPTVMTVAGSRINDWRRHSSNWGPCVALFAPGEAITTATVGSPQASIIGSGTSFAAPHAAGVAAMYLSRNPNAQPSEVFGALYHTATEGQLFDVNGSPNRLLFAFPEYLTASISGPAAITVEGNYEWTAVVDGSNGPFTYQWDLEENGNTYPNVSSGNSYQRYVGPSYHSFILRLKVTSSSSTKMVMKSIAVDVPCEDPVGVCPIPPNRSTGRTIVGLDWPHHRVP